MKRAAASAALLLLAAAAAGCGDGGSPTVGEGAVTSLGTPEPDHEAAVAAAIEWFAVVTLIAATPA